MIAILLAAQIAVADSVYSSSALRALIDDASRQNRRVPAALSSYRADVESEMAILGRRAEALESAVTIEQIRTELHWRRSGEFEQRVIGYRAQSFGLNVSALSFFDQAWAVPALYGNRIALLFGRDTSTKKRPRRGAPNAAQYAVHPLAEDRDGAYRFSGGDTLITMRVGGRGIPVVRVMVEPRDDLPAATLVFRGELDLDATRRQLVRMRGAFLRVGGKRTFMDRVRAAGFQSIALVELVNGELEGNFWLPTYQRFEAQSAFAGTTEERGIFRIISRFGDYRINGSSWAPLDSAAIASAYADTMIAVPHRLSFAPRDSVQDFTAWRHPLGTATADVQAEDFADLQPDVWRPTGAPIVAVRAQRLGDLVHFNRIEGLYTGMGVEYRLRDRAPGVTLRATSGYAWHEGTMRGHADATWRRGSWTLHGRAGRTLDVTNDFLTPFDSGSTIGALIFGVDDYDYVDRRFVALGAEHRVGRARDLRIRLESGLTHDGDVAMNASRGLLRPDSGFRANRGVREGSYLRSMAVVEWHPDVNTVLLRPGAGAQFAYERGDGDLDYQRVTAMFTTRGEIGPLALAARLHGGLLFGASPPPQQLFELGSEQNLPGYDYKQFGGDRAAVARGRVSYTLGLLRAPLRLTRRIILPSPSPMLSLGMQSAWTELRGVGARQAAAELGLRPPLASGGALPLSVATRGVRTSVDLQLRFFGGALGAGVARPVDRSARWRGIVSFSQLL